MRRIGIFLGFLAMLIAGVVIYNEYNRQQMLTNKPTIIETLQPGDCRLNEDEKVCDLIYSKQSTTAYFKKICPTGFNVFVLNQSWRGLKPGEHEALTVPNEDLVFVREVVLRCHDTVLMYARSVFPEDILNGEGKVFEHLGNRSLGEVLYQDPHLKRELISVQQIDQTSKDYAMVAEYMSTRPKNLWARTSRFYYYGKPLLLYEIFMPPLVAAVRETDV